MTQPTKSRTLLWSDFERFDDHLCLTKKIPVLMRMTFLIQESEYNDTERGQKDHRQSPDSGITTVSLTLLFMVLSDAEELKQLDMILI